MELYQVSVFGEKKVIKENNKKSKRNQNKNTTLKQKLKSLYKLYYLIYETQNINLLEQREVIIKGDLIIYPQDNQAEPLSSINMNVLDDIDKRIEIAEEKYKELTRLK